MRINLKTRIWLTIFSIVFVFTMFIMVYFPAQQEKYVLKNFNKEIQNLANTVSLGVKIALTEQNFEGVETAMDFIKGDSRLNFVAMIMTDTLWNDSRDKFSVSNEVLVTYPEGVKVDASMESSDSLIIKRSTFETEVMNGQIMTGFSTTELSKNMRQIRLLALIVSCVVFFFGIGVGLWLARTISVPVLAIRDAAQKVGAGDRTQLVMPSTNDEIGELSVAFNKMVSDLSSAEENIIQKNNDLVRTLQDLKKAQTQLIQSEKLASLGQLTAGIAHEIKNPLNFVNNFSEISEELVDEAITEIMANKTLSEKEKLEELDDILKDLQKNSKKIHEHGKRADSIVKGMLEHSRVQSKEKKLTNVKSLIEENVKLAFHGFRAKHKDFNVKITKNLAEDIGEVEIVPQNIGRVVINIANNAFDALAEKSSNNNGFEPEFTISSRLQDSMVEISLKDNGPGIPDEIKNEIFNPFFTTKPTGYGNTGLGLSLSYDIVCKEHDGRMILNSELGKFTEFKILLPAAN